MPLTWVGLNPFQPNLEGWAESSPTNVKRKKRKKERCQVCWVVVDPINLAGSGPYGWVGPFPVHIIIIIIIKILDNNKNI
jgi:hypothetical protein